MIKSISLGWGVQSWTMAAMSALGELEKVDLALHSNTTWEREETYEFIETWTPWLEDRGVSVVTVSDYEQARQVASGEPDIPAFTKVSGNIVHIPAHLIQNENGGKMPPLHTTYPTGKKSGMLRRQCTHRWKIWPMRKYLRQMLDERGLSKQAGVVEQWLGITVDEIHRAKDSDVKWINHRFPLLEKRMTRQDCIIWLQNHNLPVPPKSSCVFCPYHTRQTFAEMKRANGPDWQIAIEVDEAIRDKRPGYACYVHPDRIPLTEVTIAEDFGATQLEMFVNDSDAECDSGYCFL